MLKLKDRSAFGARAAFALSVVAAFAAGYALSAARAAGIHFEPLVSAGETILGEAFVYPPGKPKITTGILFLADPANSFMTGHALALDGGIGAV